MVFRVWHGMGCHQVQGCLTSTLTTGNKPTCADPADGPMALVKKPRIRKFEINQRQWCNMTDQQSAPALCKRKLRGRTCRGQPYLMYDGDSLVPVLSCCQALA